MKVERPWGWYEVIDEGDRYKTKNIVVNPGARLSLQMHYHRSEHWIVVVGTAKVRVGDVEKLLFQNESITLTYQKSIFINIEKFKVINY